VTFPTSAYLRKATSRAKSDVANKLVSMFLHDLSRKVSASLQLSVTDSAYAEAVASEFGSRCCYCSQELERDRSSVEHLEGMNRFRLGLHIPGNVIVACKRCNGEKRRDDQLHQLILAETGWESFLSHDSTRCGEACNSCGYWRTVWPDSTERSANLVKARQNIAVFRNRYPESLKWATVARTTLCSSVDSLYRECQEFATVQIRRSVDEAFSSLSSQVSQNSAVQASADLRTTTK
jgi:hypothetical protein